MKSFFSVLFILLVLAASSACAQKVKASFARGDYQVTVGRTMQIQPDVSGWSGHTAFEYSSSDETVASVAKNGVVSGNQAGEAEIFCRVTAGDYTFDLSYKMTVYVKIRKIEAAESRVVMNVQETYDPTLIFTPEDATFQTLSWASSNEKVAAVDENGTVTAVGRGHALITGKVKDHDWHTVQYRVIVPLITFEQQKVVLEEPESATITFRVNMDEGSYSIQTAQDGGYITLTDSVDDTKDVTAEKAECQEYYVDIMPRRAGKGRFIVYINRKGYSIPVEVTKEAVEGLPEEEETNETVEETEDITDDEEYDYDEDFGDDFDEDHG